MVAIHGSLSSASFLHDTVCTAREGNCKNDMVTVCGLLPLLKALQTVSPQTHAQVMETDQPLADLDCGYGDCPQLAEYRLEYYHITYSRCAYRL